MLSREEAIKKHRDMWNWIAERIKESKSVQDIDFFKAGIYKTAWKVCNISLLFMSLLYV